VLAALAVGNPALLIPAAATALAALTARTGREAVAFTAGSVAIAASVIAAFSTHAPVLLTSTLNQAWSITIDGAASSPEALRVISWAAAFVLPGVLAYQGLSYWVFRTRVHSERITASTR
jgi:cytochrome d ubiquinol oxidase subunit II